MLHKEIFGLTLLAFLLWIVFAADPSERITRVCRPMAWIGNGATSVAALTSPTYQKSVDGWFKGLDYGCRYSVWRLFYQEDYAAWEAKRDGTGFDVEKSGQGDKPEGAPQESKPAKPPAGEGL